MSGLLVPQATNELFAALSRVQAVLEGARKDSVNPFFKSKYANLESVWNAIREPLTANGLCVTQLVDHLDNKSFLVTILGHTSGQYLTSRMEMHTKDDSPQEFGKTMTYYRRYCLAAIVGVHQEEEDGNKTVVAKPAPAVEFTTQKPSFKPTGIASGAVMPVSGKTVPFGSIKGKDFSEVPLEQLVSAMNWAKDKGKFKEFVADAEAFLDKVSRMPLGGLPNHAPASDDNDEIPF